MKLLITGGAGYIGSHVVLAALDRNYEVTIFDDLSTGREKNINPNAKFIFGSIQSHEDLSNLFKHDNYNGVIHLAASKFVRESMLDPSHYTGNNIIGSLNLLDKCIQNGVKFFVFSSTASVYGKPKYIPIEESHCTNPNNYYGYTKLAIERNLKWYSALKGITFASLRYFNAAGYDLKKRIVHIENNPCNLIPVIMETIVGRRPNFSIYGNNYQTEDGTGIRDFVHVSDLAVAHIKSFEYIYSKRKSFIVNLGSEKGYSVLNILEVIKDITKVDIHYDFKAPRKGDPSKIIASCSLAKKLIGWDHKNSDIKTIINSTWEVYKEHT